MSAEKRNPESTREGARPRWSPKTPLDVVREQIEKQERRVERARQTFEEEKAALSKLAEAKKVLGA